MTNRIWRGQTEHSEHLHGGNGEIKIEYIIGSDDYAGREGEFMMVTIKPGDSIGFHEHKGETESYHILSGEGVYFDGEKTYYAKSGNTFHCVDGKGHSIENNGKEDLVFIALVLPM